MIIDCHYHYFPSEFDVEKKLLDMDAAGIDKIALIAPICPIFKSEPMSLPMRFMRLLMGKAAFYPLLKKLLCTFRGDGINILGEHVPIFFKPGNKAVFEAADTAPERLSAWVTVNPDRQSEEEMRREILEYADRETFCGVKAHPFYHQYDVAKLDAVCRILEPLRKPMLIHLPFDSKDAILALADRHPKVNFLLAHCAFPYFDLIWPDLKKRKNIYVDLSSGCYVDAKMARRAIDALGPYHVLYGSDGPYGTLKSDGSFDMQAEYEFATKQIRAEELRAIRKNNFVFLMQTTT